MLKSLLDNQTREPSLIATEHGGRLSNLTVETAKNHVT
jgi:hypothetical protein